MRKVMILAAAAAALMVSACNTVAGLGWAAAYLSR